MKKSKAIVILIVILGALAGLAYYASIILSSTGIGEEMSIPLGLDLSGGASSISTSFTSSILRILSISFSAIVAIT